MLDTIRHAIAQTANCRFILHGQPIKPISACAIDPADSYEALLRLQITNQPHDRLIMPAAIFGAIEAAPDRTELAIAIDWWVLKRVALLLSECPNLKLAANFSRALIAEPNLVDRIHALFGDNIGRLTLEINERDRVYRANEIAVLEQLGASVTLLLDDCNGNTLNHLLLLPIHGIKIDGGLIRDCATDDRRQSLLRMLFSFASETRLSVVCEYVESEQIWSFLRQMARSFPTLDLSVQGFAVGAFVVLEAGGDRCPST